MVLKFSRTMNDFFYIFIVFLSITKSIKNFSIQFVFPKRDLSLNRHLTFNAREYQQLIQKFWDYSLLKLTLLTAKRSWCNLLGQHCTISEFHCKSLSTPLSSPHIPTYLLPPRLFFFPARQLRGNNFKFPPEPVNLTTASCSYVLTINPGALLNPLPLGTCLPVFPTPPCNTPQFILLLLPTTGK